MANRMAVTPAHSASMVSMFGSSRLIDRPRRRGGRVRLRVRSLRMLMSTHLPKPGLLVRVQIGDDGFAADGGLADDHLGVDTIWQIDVGPTAEADQAVALASRDGLARLQVADDAPGDKAGDLDEGDFTPVFQTQADRHPLVLLARLVQRRVEELALVIGRRLDRAGGGRPVDVNVEDIEED